MAKTFFALLDLADIDHAQSKAKTEPVEVIKDEEGIDNNETETSSNTTQTQQNILVPGLHYNIQIHLPATKDIEVYNSIFKSLKEHLIG